jgi:hypothetical protein
MIPHYRFKNSSTRRLFDQLANDPDVQPSSLRNIAHISSRISEDDWKIFFLDLITAHNTRLAGRRR